MEGRRWWMNTETEAPLMYGNINKGPHWTQGGESCREEVDETRLAQQKREEKNCIKLHGRKSLQIIRILVSAASVWLGADRCSCSPVNRAASASVVSSCLHAKNAQLCIWENDLLSMLRHAGSAQLTYSNIAQLSGPVKWHFSHVEPYFGHSQGSFCLPFHSSGLYVSLPFPPPTAPWTPRGQQAARLSGCRALWDGTDDNLCAPQGLSRDRTMDRTAEWRDREEEKDKITEVRGVRQFCDFTPQANTYVRRDGRGKS